MLKPHYLYILGFVFKWFPLTTSRINWNGSNFSEPHIVGSARSFSMFPLFFRAPLMQIKTDPSQEYRNLHQKLSARVVKFCRFSDFFHPEWCISPFVVLEAFNRMHSTGLLFTEFNRTKISPSDSQQLRWINHSS